MSPKKQWFEVDRKGLESLMRRRAGDQGGGELGLAFMMFELLQNAYDEDVKEVHAALQVTDRRGRASLCVVDDSPDGFRDLRDSWTLFKPSYKASNPTKRGRFNLGEKLVLALCESAQIVSTCGGVSFDDKGRHTLRRNREAGTEFTAIVKITNKDVERIDSAMQLLIPAVPTTYNGSPLAMPDPVATNEGVSLPTEFAGDDGELRRTVRQTSIEIYEPLTEGGGWIYEMGIPVVHTGDRFSVNVLQVVPLSIERDNVTPGFLRKVRAHALNATAHLLDEDDAAESWVKEATNAPEIEAEAFDQVLDHTHGKDRFMWDPSNTEAGKDLISQGWTPVYGNQLSAGQRKNIRIFRGTGSDLAKPAGQLSSAGGGAYSNDPDAPPVNVIPPKEYTEGMARVVAYAKHMSFVVGVGEIKVRVVSTTNGFSAAYGNRTLDLNLRRLGHAWFNGHSLNALSSVNQLFIHELAHEYEGDHLSSRYHDACCRIGAKLAQCALVNQLRPASYGYAIKGGAHGE